MPRRSASVQLELAELIGSRKTQSLATENGRAGLTVPNTLLAQATEVTE